jgi:hypothetical protein
MLLQVSNIFFLLYVSSSFCLSDIPCLVPEISISFTPYIIQIIPINLALIL